MNVELIRDEVILKNLTRDDILFCNISGADTGSVFFKPKKPEHSIKIKITEPEIVEMLQSRNVNVVEKLDDDKHILYWQFKIVVRPRITQNKVTGNDEQFPKILIKDSSTPSVRLSEEAFRLIDKAVYRDNIVEMSIAFHAFLATTFNRWTTSLDELKLVAKSYDELTMVADESPSGSGYLGDDEDVPF